MTVVHGDCRALMRAMAPESVDAIVSDPPYGLTQNKKGGSGVASVNLSTPSGRARIGTGNGPGGFMGMKWDGAVPGVEFWREALRVAKPGAHLVAFGGTRTVHRLAVAIEDAGWEIRDSLVWLYGSGFPKSLDVGKAIDKAAGATREVLRARTYTETDGGGYSGGLNTSQPRSLSCELTAPATDAARQWDGWGTALKPAHEPIVLARKPLVGTVAANVQAHGTGALNVDATRIGTGGHLPSQVPAGMGYHGAERADTLVAGEATKGRWPANVLLDEDAAAMLDAQSGERKSGAGNKNVRNRDDRNAFGKGLGAGRGLGTGGDTGGASRFFFVARHSDDELLFSRARAILEAWNPDLAGTVDDRSSLPSAHAVSVLAHAVTVASHGETQLSGLTGLGTSATPLALRMLCESVIAGTLSFADAPSPALPPGRPTPSPGPANGAGPREPNGTTTTTIGHSISDGSAVVATLAPTLTSAGAGGPGSDADGARFRYCAKASRSERGPGNDHPTLKPLALMRWLVRLVTPPGGLVLDPFAGSGTTGVAAVLEGMRFVGCEQAAEYVEIAEARIAHAVQEAAAPPAPDQLSLLATTETP